MPTEDVHVHFQKCEVEYLQFAFRWMNNLLMRELPLRCTIRLWDTYQVQLHQHQPKHVGKAFTCAFVSNLCVIYLMVLIKVAWG